MTDTRALRSFIEKATQDRRLIVVSNREPYVHRKQEQDIVWEQPVGGLTSALDDVLRLLGGVWVAWGSGDADRRTVDRKSRVRVPPDQPSYTLKRVWLTPGEVENYYNGYSNHVLWPLCHIALERVYLRHRYWEDYVSANHRFARAVGEEVESGTMVWIHDYHLALLPALLRADYPDLTLAHFWHVPWPNFSVLRVCPQARELVEGMLANDLIGFQVSHFASNFMDCVEKLIPDAEVDRERAIVSLKGHETRLEAFPISVDFERFHQMASSRRSQRFMEKLRRRLNLAPDILLGVGVDRLEYTKGLTKRLQAIELFFERFPKFRKRFTFFQVAVPTRASEPYIGYGKGVQALVRQVNQRFGTAEWKPVIYTEAKMEHRELAALYREADLCIVSSVYDGMNLVAKEFISCQTEEKGVLLLSEFAGAAEELDEAIIVNPYDLESFSESIRDALAMGSRERRKRMRTLRERVSAADINTWIRNIIQRMSDLASARSGGTAFLFRDIEQIALQDLFLFLDFDGTLSPIAPTPEEARFPVHVQKILNKLKKVMPVAIISGRSLEDVRSRVGIPDLVYSGNHGMEIWNGREMVRQEAGDISRLEELVEELIRTFRDIPQVIVEHKRLSASLHFRKVPPKKLARVFGRFWEVTRPYDAHFNVSTGKKVLEIRSKEAWNKGDAVTWILEAIAPTRHPVYIGDDVTDEDAFRAIRGKGTSISVGRNPEADYYLENQDQVGKFLEWLYLRTLFFPELAGGQGN